MPNENTQMKVLYLLPNLFTAASIFLAILSLLASVKGDFEKAGWLIVLAAVFDTLDGRVARLTKTTSRFGAEFDSLADVIAFGLAPAMLLYFAHGINHGKFGILAAALFVIFGAVRLARFNVTAPETGPNVFVGLPIPSAAIFLVTWVLLMDHYDLGRPFDIALLLAAIFLAAMMVSHVRYPSFKRIDFHSTRFIRVLLLLIVLASLIYLYPLRMVTLIITLYVLWGPARALYHLLRRKGRPAT